MRTLTLPGISLALCVINKTFGLCEINPSIEKLEWTDVQNSKLESDPNKQEPAEQSQKPILSHLFIPITEKANMVAQLVNILTLWREHPPCQLGGIPEEEQKVIRNRERLLPKDSLERLKLPTIQNHYFVNILRGGRIEKSVQYNTTAVFGLFEMPKGQDLLDFPIVCQHILDEFGDCFRKIEFQGMILEGFGDDSDEAAPSTREASEEVEASKLRRIHEELIDGKLLRRDPTMPEALTNVFVLHPRATPVQPFWLAHLHELIEKERRTKDPFSDNYWIAGNYGKFIDTTRRVLNPFAMYHLPSSYLINLTPESSYPTSFYPTYVRNHLDMVISKGYHQPLGAPSVDMDREFLNSWAPLSKQFVHFNYVAEVDAHIAFSSRSIAEKYPSVFFVHGGIRDPKSK